MDFTCFLVFSNGQWVRVKAHRCGDNEYDLFIIRRVTAEREKVAAYERWLHQAEEASQFKTSFLFRMSHEI